MSSIYSLHQSSRHNMDRKDSTRAAMDAYIRRECAPENTTAPKRQNKTPERDTERAVLRWAKDNGFFFHVVESSRFDPLLGQMGSAKAQAGMSDLIGNTPNGLACFVELKAKGRRSALSEQQRHFLKQKIEQNCFAVVVDSAESIARQWSEFCSCSSQTKRQEYLMHSLPKEKSRPPRDDFEKRHGF